MIHQRNEISGKRKVQFQKPTVISDCKIKPKLKSKKSSCILLPGKQIVLNVYK